MKTREIKAARAMKGYKQEDVARILGIPASTYAAKENGRSPFTDDQKIALAAALELSDFQLNDYLYDGKLPIGIA